MTDTMRNILLVMLAGNCIVLTLFVVLYGFFSNWRKTMAGRALFWVSVGWAGAWDLTWILSRWTPTSIRSIFILQFLVFAYTFVASTYLFYTLLYNQRLDRNEARHKRKVEKDGNKPEGPTGEGELQRS